jgi:hypothetical protein
LLVDVSSGLLLLNGGNGSVRVVATDTGSSAVPIEGMRFVHNAVAVRLPCALTGSWTGRRPGWVTVKSDESGFRVESGDQSGFALEVDNNSQGVTRSQYAIEAHAGVLLDDAQGEEPASASGARLYALAGALHVAQHAPPTVTGSRGGNAALASLLAALANVWLVVQGEHVAARGLLSIGAFPRRSVRLAAEFDEPPLAPRRRPHGPRPQPRARRRARWRCPRGRAAPAGRRRSRADSRHVRGSAGTRLRTPCSHDAYPHHVLVAWDRLELLRQRSIDFLAGIGGSWLSDYVNYPL